jgi:mannose-6-phosphate isomerase-like protein (cupin superfamily)
MEHRRTQDGSASQYGWHGCLDFWTLVDAREGLGVVVVFQEVHKPIPHHLHDDFDEIYAIESGTGTVCLGETEFPVGAHDVVVVPRGSPHAVDPGPQGLRMWVFGQAPEEGIAEPTWLERRPLDVA